MELASLLTLNMHLHVEMQPFMKDKKTSSTHSWSMGRNLLCFVKLTLAMVINSEVTCFVFFNLDLFVDFPPQRLGIVAPK